MQPAFRRATSDDEAVLRELDHATWSPQSSPAPPPSADAVVLEAEGEDEVLVAVVDGAVVGYVKVGPDIPLASHRHVLQIKGLAVAPDWQQQGLGRRLVHAAIETATARGARKLTLRVFATNPVARRLYESCGFVVEGILRGEFRREDAYVDDVLMALALPAER